MVRFNLSSAWAGAVKAPEPEASWRERSGAMAGIPPPQSAEQQGAKRAAVYGKSPRSLAKEAVAAAAESNPGCSQTPCAYAQQQAGIDLVRAWGSGGLMEVTVPVATAAGPDVPIPSPAHSDSDTSSSDLSEPSTDSNGESFFSAQQSPVVSAREKGASPHFSLNSPRNYSLDGHPTISSTLPSAPSHRAVMEWDEAKPDSGAKSPPSASLSAYASATESPVPQSRQASHRGPLDPAGNIDLSQLLLLQTLGVGMFAEVRMYIRLRDGLPVAVKILREAARNDPVAIKDFAGEIELFRTLPPFPTIIAAYGTGIYRNPNGEGDLPFLALECAKGTLTQQLTASNPIPPDTALGWAIDIGSAIAFLHSQKPYRIMHRDIKSDNVLICGDGRAKLGDFGLSKRCFGKSPARTGEDGWDGKHTGKTGSYLYMAPEVYMKGYYDHRVDVFSFGILLLELLSSKPAYDLLPCSDDQAAHGYAYKNLRPTMEVFFPEVITDMLHACWAANPADRPEVDNVVRHLRAIRKDPSVMKKLRNMANSDPKCMGPRLFRRRPVSRPNSPRD